MAVNVAINGFGRIGRLVFRALHEQGMVGSDINIVAVGDIVPADNLAYLLKYDSIQGRFAGEVSHGQSEGADAPDQLIVNGDVIKVVSARTPDGLPWADLGVDIVIESTGLFASAEASQGHITAGAKKVIISAPAKGDVKTVVMGVNHENYDPAAHNIVSNASCTTNCLAPLAKVVHDNFGIVSGLMTTVHATTATQKPVDSPSLKDWRGGRGAGQSIIPSSTGAAKAVGRVIPELNGKLTGMAFRVPTPDVSVVDLTVNLDRPTSYENLKQTIKQASQNGLSGILGYTEDPIVSNDLLGESCTSVFDAGAGMALNDRFMKLVAWYDNEWAYSCKCIDLMRHMATHQS